MPCPSTDASIHLRIDIRMWALYTIYWYITTVRNACVPASYTRLSSLCYWSFYMILSLSLKFVRIPAVVTVRTISSLAAPWVVVMTISRAAGEVCGIIRTGDHRAPVWSFLNILACIETHVIRFICMLGNILLWFFIEHVLLCIHSNVFRVMLCHVWIKKFQPLLIIFIIYKYVKNVAVYSTQYNGNYKRGQNQRHY